MTTHFPVPPMDPGEVDPLHRLAVYRLALEAMQVGKRDAEGMRGDRYLAEVAGQLLRATGSIAANIAEGYSRGSAADRRKFLEYALGSTRESIVWYETSEVAGREDRVERLISVRRLLLAMIRTARRDTARDRTRFAK